MPTIRDRPGAQPPRAAAPTPAPATTAARQEALRALPALLQQSAQQAAATLARAQQGRRPQEIQQALQAVHVVHALQLMPPEQALDALQALQALQAQAQMQAGRAPAATTMTTTPTATRATTTHGDATPAWGERYERSPRLAELVLGGQAHASPVVTTAGPRAAPTGAQKVYEVRLAAVGMHTRDDVALGKKPVLPPGSLQDGKVQRYIQPDPAWALREASNWPFLYPGRYLSSQDLIDFQVHKRSPTVRAALDEIIRAAGPAAVRDPVLLPPGALARIDAAQLSPVAGFVLQMMRPYDGNQTFDGIFMRAFAHTVAQHGYGGTLVAAATMERIAPGGAAFFEACREAVPDRRGLQATLHRAQLPIEPVCVDTPLTREEAAAILATDPRVLDQMVASAPIPATLPMLEDALALVPDGAFADCHVVAVQHVLATNHTMFRALERKGLDPSRAEIVGIPYSTSYVVEHALRARGYAIDTPDVVDPNDITGAYEVAVEAALDRAVARALVDGRPILLIDDGGKATTLAAKKYPQHAHLFRAVEQTTRGITELAHLQAAGTTPGFPIVDVAGAPLKKHESTKIGAQIAGEIEGLLAGTGLAEVRGRAVTVIGCGTIGLGTARALQALGARVTVWDIDEAKRKEAAAHFDVPATREEALRGKSLVVGATGHRSITREDTALLDHECVLASASSRDVEIDLSINRDKDVQTVPLLSAGRGDKRFITRVWRFAQKDVVVLRNGFPLNFRGDYETGTHEDIQQTRALMVLAAAQAIAAPAGAPAGGPLVALSLDAQRAFASRAGVPAP